ncbi:MAG: FAD-binding and (Fe-S)-binding domain-containing protein [Leptonema sp. (in: bacteria)]
MAYDQNKILKILFSHFPKENVLFKEVDLISYSSDASFYTLKPLVVVRPKNIDDIQFLFNISQKLFIALTFRAAGTSLSGQSITNGILVDVGYYWKSYTVLGKGESIILEPGIIGSYANEVLKPFSRKIGPDPASINSCMIGGILANNASGMCCGVADNSYHTLEKIKVVLTNGYVLDTFQEKYREKFKEEQPILYNEILRIRNFILENSDLVNKIQTKYKIKNTTGYSLNAFIDFSDPADIVSHLMIGSEGTLGFITKAQLRTIPDKKFKLTGLLCFQDVFSACEIIPYLRERNASSVELMDRSAIRSIEHKEEVPSFLKELPKEATVLLIEFEADSEEEIVNIKIKIQEDFQKIPLLLPPFFTTNQKEREKLWKVRKGLFPSVSAIRKSKTTVIIEDIAFPLENLPYATLELQKLFQKHNYTDAIIFGHAKDGNLHFVITQSFHDSKDIQRYDSFIVDVVEMVVKKFNGSLKAEHGTGRNMAPFVELEWGSTLYKIMQDIKKLFDPNFILNPDVIISNHPKIHLENLKKIPEIEDIANMCLECGFCESVCPSKNITSTPRKRILLRREMERNTKIANSKYWDYYFYQTCIRCGLCETVCPISINTGELVKLNHSKKRSFLFQKISEFLVSQFSILEKLIKVGFYFILFAFKILKKFSLENKFKKLLFWLNQKLRIPFFVDTNLKISNFSKFIKKYSKPKEIDFYYFPTCTSRVLSSSQIEIFEIMQEISREFNIGICILDSKGYCCSQPFESKALYKAKTKMEHITYDFLKQIDPNIPIIVDNSSCNYSFKKNHIFRNFKFFDSLEFIKILYQKQPEKFKKIYNKIYIQNICSIQKLKLESIFLEVGKILSKEVEYNPFPECCGFAGDRGFFYPEVNLSSIQTIKERLETSVKKEKIDRFFSSNTTCEFGLSRTGYPFTHVLQGVYESIKKT